MRESARETPSRVFYRLHCRVENVTHTVGCDFLHSLVNVRRPTEEFNALTLAYYGLIAVGKHEVLDGVLVVVDSERSDDNLNW